MYKLAEPLFLKVETPLHAGSGAMLGVVDLPIQRERHTGFPKIEGSSLKGSLREAFEEYKSVTNQVSCKKLTETFTGLQENKKWEIVKSDGSTMIKRVKSKELTVYDQTLWLAFGPEDDSDNETHAGALGFTDARLLLFPVKSMKGVFAYITCPAALKRLQDDLQLCANTGMTFQNFESFKKKCDEVDKAFAGNATIGQCVPTKDSALKVKGSNDEFVILEEYSFKTKPQVDSGDLVNFLDQLIGNKLQGVKTLKTNLVILHDDDFRDFVSLATEVITRIKINNETGTVAKGQLFTEEYLPSESLLYSVVLATSIFQPDDKKGLFNVTTPESEEQRVMTFFKKGLPSVFQLGGNATIGKGLIRTRMNGAAS